MKQKRPWNFPLILLVVLVFAFSLVIETQAWGRVGGGRSFGSRGSRSYSTPSSPSSPSSSSRYGSGTSSPGSPQSATQPYSGGLSRSPFTQGLMGGLAGGFLGSMLFGGSGHAAAGGGAGGGGIGLMDIALIGLLIYFAMKFFRRRQQQSSASAGYYNANDAYSERIEGASQYSRIEPSSASAPQAGVSGSAERDAGLARVRQFDPAFSEESFKDSAQDMFFRIQAAWMNRSLDGIEPLLTSEMAGILRQELSVMIQQGKINRLENIAVRKVELSEIWQETGKDFITVLFTANLLDYTVDDKTGQVIEGDRLNPVKFQEFWTFCRDIGSGSAWRLSAIQQTA